MELGAFIRTNRKKLDLTQEAIANFLGYDNYQMISNIERGIASIPFPKVPKLAQCLQVDEREILETSFKGRKLADKRDLLFLFERGKDTLSSTRYITLDKEDEPELYKIITKARNSKLRDKFIRISEIVLDLSS